MYVHDDAYTAQLVLESDNDEHVVPAAKGGQHDVSPAERKLGQDERDSSS